MISNFLNSNLLQDYLNRNFAQPTDTGVPVQNKLYEQPYNMFDVSGGITSIPNNVMAPATSFQDFYSPVYEPYDPEKNDEQVSYSELVGRPSFSDTVSKFAKNIIGQPGISSLIGFFNPLAGAVSKGLGYLGRNLSPSFVGPKGARPYGSETPFGIFARSNTLADVFQNMRDKKARDEAAARGAAKQRAAKDKARMDAFRAFKDSKPSGSVGGGGGIGSSSGGAASPGSQGPGGSDAMGSS